MNRSTLVLLVVFGLVGVYGANVYLSNWIEPVIRSPTTAIFACCLGVTCAYAMRLKTKVSKPNRSKIIVEDDLTSTTPQYDVVIVGAGVIGSAIGAALKNVANCRKALVIEQSWKEPKRIVGELLQPGGVDQLKKLHLEASLKGIDAQPVHGYGVFLDKEKTKIEYPNHARGYAFHNGRFVMNLRKLAKQNPRLEAREGIVKKLLYTNDRVTGVQYVTKDGKTQSVRASLTIVCDGCFSLLRAPLTNANVLVRSKFLGLVIKNAKLPFGKMGHVMLTNPTPTLAYPISSTESRMLIDFPEGIPDAKNGELQKYLFTRLLPQLPAPIQGPFKEAVLAGGEEDDNAKITFLSMPNRTLAARGINVPGAVLIGDSLNMRHPLTGGGMTVGFTDVVHFISTIKKVKDFKNPQELAEKVEEFYQKRRNDASSINILADALYQVFAADSDMLRNACFAYLKQGGWYSHGPISLLSGLSRSQTLLIKHFFCVAFFAMKREISPFPTPASVYRSLKILRRAVEIIIPLLEIENKCQPHGLGFLATVFCRFSRFVFWV